MVFRLQQGVFGEPQGLLGEPEGLAAGLLGEPQAPILSVSGSERSRREQLFREPLKPLRQARVAILSSLTAPNATPWESFGIPRIDEK